MGDLLVLNPVIKQKGRGGLSIVRDFDGQDLGIGYSVPEAVLNAQAAGALVVTVMVDGLDYCAFVTRTHTSLVQHHVDGLYVQLVSSPEQELDDDRVHHVILRAGPDASIPFISMLEGAFRPDLFFRALEVLVAIKSVDQVAAHPDQTIQTEINQILGRQDGRPILPVDRGSVVETLSVTPVQPAAPWTTTSTGTLDGKPTIKVVDLHSLPDGTRPIPDRDVVVLKGRLVTGQEYAQATGATTAGLLSPDSGMEQTAGIPDAAINVPTSHQVPGVPANTSTSVKP